MNAEEKKIWKENLVKQTEKKVLEVRNSEKFKKYLLTMARFHSYSLRNVNLIYAQDPGATKIAGYRQWQNDFGRQVKRGAKAIHICAPITRKLTKKEKVEEHTNQDQKIVGYRYIPVFDISQTTGKHIPDPRDFSNRNLKSNKSISKIYDGMVEYLNVHSDFTVTEKRLDRKGLDGHTDISTKEILINSKNQNASYRLATLFHEYAHSQLHGRDFTNVPIKERKNYAEVQAEAVAYIAMDNVGVDTSGYSLGYMATWANDAKMLHKALDDIYKVSKKTIEVTDKVMSQIGLDKQISAPIKSKESEIIEPKEINVVKKSSKLEQESINMVSTDSEIKGLEL